MSNIPNEKIEEEFLELVYGMSNEQFWRWTRSWLDSGTVMEIIKDWDIETMWEELKTLKKKARKRGVK